MSSELWGVWFTGGNWDTPGWCKDWNDNPETYTTRHEAEASAEGWAEDTGDDAYEVRAYVQTGVTGGGVVPGSGSSVDYVGVGLSVGKLCEEKNAAYGDSFARSGEVMSILYPNGINAEQMTDALGVVRVLDKLFRIASRKNAFGESPWKDIAGYGVLGAARDEK